MSYPYADPYYAAQHQQQYTAQPQPYTDAAAYDPYNNRQQHPTYDQSGYHDDDAYRNGSPTANDNDGLGRTKEKGQYDEPFTPPDSTGAIRLWRKDHHGPLWTKGGRGRVFLRFYCCCNLIFIFLLISILFSLGIWIRPPDITINEIALNTTGGSAAQVSSTSLSLNFAVNISVDNPNYFDVNFQDIKANLTYPLNNMYLGGGEKDDITFKSYTTTTFEFPFTATYNLTSDSNQVVLKDLLNKCGFTGTAQDITMDYKITLGLKIVVLKVSPSFSDSFSFACPTSEIESFLQAAGISISSLTGLGG